MRYTYYRNKQPASGGSSNRLRILLILLVVLMVAGWFFVWNSMNSYPPEALAEEALYEGYFNLNTRLDQILSRRFPALEYQAGNLSSDGVTTRTYTVKAAKSLHINDLENVLKNTLGGYGFKVRRTAESGADWEFQIGSDSTVWAIYHFQFPEGKKLPVSMLPADIAKVSGKPKIAVVVDDFGYSMNETINGFLNLKVPFTAAVIPGRAYSKQVDERLDSRGIPTLIHMPMITINNTTSEPDYVLSDDLSSGEIQRRLRKALKEVPKAVGMNNHQGSGGTQSRKVMTEVVDFLAARKMFFIDSRTIAASVGEAVARERGVPTNSRDVFLDDVDDTAAISGELFRLARIAKKHGEAIAIGHCRPNTLATLKKYLPALIEAGFELVPVSQLVR